MHYLGKAFFVVDRHGNEVVINCEDVQCFIPTKKGTPTALFVKDRGIVNTLVSTEEVIDIIAGMYEE